MRGKFMQTFKSPHYIIGREGREEGLGTRLTLHQTTLIQLSSAAAERVFSLLANSFNSNQESAPTHRND